MDSLPEPAVPLEQRDMLPSFDAMLAALPDAQREVLTLLKVVGLSLEEVACATASTVGAVKQKAHRAYKRLRQLLQTGAEEDRSGGAQ
jgi:RNA polymerase sigma-70 factor (ECF subfamily)